MVEEKPPYQEWHDDPGNWKFGVFYFNRQDKRILVPKRIELLGWTINFANPVSILSFVFIILVVLVIEKIVT